MKRLLAVVLSLTLLAAVLPGGVSGVRVAGEANSHVTAVPSGYTGIYTKGDLNAIRNNLSGKYILMNDIVFDQRDFMAGYEFYNNGAGWKPIGDENAPFTGELDGNGYAIKNLVVKAQGSGKVYAGLFGYSKGVISNLGMVDSQITATANTALDMSSSYGGNYDAYAYAYAGGIVGYTNYNTMTNCYNTGDVEAKVISSSNSSFANLYNYAGGIAGYGGSRAVNCYNTGDVKATMSQTATESGDQGVVYAGGIYGHGSTYMESCYNTGKVSVSTSASATGFNSIRTYVGGIVGRGLSSVDGCYNTGDLSVVSGTAVGMEEMLYTGGIAGEIESILNSYNTGDVKVTVQKEHITSLHVGGVAGVNENGITKSYNTGCVQVTAARGDSYGDMYIYTGGVVGLNKDTVTQCYNTGEVIGDVSAPFRKSSKGMKGFVGGIVGLDQGSVTECYNAGYVDVRNEDADVFVGGVVGQSESGADIANCYNAADVHVAMKSSFEVEYVYIYVGGVVGNANNGATDCYNAGLVYLSGDETTYRYAGGIAGKSNGTLSDCYYLDNIAKGVAMGTDSPVKCTAESMQKQATFAGLDFNTVWTMEGNEDYLYPELQQVEMEYTKALVSIALVTAPTKADYIQGEGALDVSGGKLELTYNNGTTEVKDLTAEMVSGFDNTQVGPQTLTVTYEGFTCTFDVTVQAAEDPSLLGDVDSDGTITSTDARLTLQYYANKIRETDLDISVADVDGDGQITSTDARLILQKYANKIEEFPAQK